MDSVFILHMLQESNGDEMDEIDYDIDSDVVNIVWKNGSRTKIEGFDYVPWL